MKRSAIIPVMLLGLTLSSCLVTSIHPFYRNKDKKFETHLLGTWIDNDSSIWVFEKSVISEGIFGPEREDSTYSITYYEDDNQKAYLQATLFELEGQQYVDFFPHPDEDHCRSEMVSFHHIPVHTLARLKFSQDTMIFFWLGEEWLNDLLEERRIRIDHEQVIYGPYYGRNVLTAGTDDLQKFILKYMNDEEMITEIENAIASNEEVKDHVMLKLFPHEGEIPEDK
ncbi:MAG: hypothetical protein K9J30_12985 [Bacteroidales bacterium]|nr:hypothetical protein [Bacteroidales bacterium]